MKGPVSGISAFIIQELPTLSGYMRPGVVLHQEEPSAPALRSDNHSEDFIPEPNSSQGTVDLDMEVCVTLQWCASPDHHWPTHCHDEQHLDYYQNDVVTSKAGIKKPFDHFRYISSAFRLVFAELGLMDHRPRSGNAQFFFWLWKSKLILSENWERSCFSSWVRLTDQKHVVYVCTADDRTHRDK